MKYFSSTALLSLSLCAVAKSHFVLQVPTSLGFDDDMESMAPCGGFNATTRTNVTDFPINGGDIGVLTTHPSVIWEYRAALVRNLTNWVSLTPKLNQTTGVGYLCEPEVPGVRKWIGEPAVLQLIQHGTDGDLYQVCFDTQYLLIY
jgi:hypothetical protein